MNDWFEEFIEIILKHEGGYVWDHDDPGGETNYGISRRFLDENGLFYIDIKSLNRKKAVYLYREYFWPEWIILLPDKILALQAFDFGVNAGIRRSAKMLQRSCGVKQDGYFGPVSNAAVYTIIEERGSWYMRMRYLNDILLYYVKIKGEKFDPSWVNRAVGNVIDGIELL